MKDDNFFWPPNNSDFPAWLANFTDFVDKNSEVLGFTTSEVTWLKTNSTVVTYVEKMLFACRKLESGLVNIRDIIYLGDPENPALPAVNWLQMQDVGTAPAPATPNMKATLNGYVKRVATCNDITREQKRNAGVLSRQRKKVNPDDATPELKVTVVNGQAVLDCPLRSFKGYLVYVEDDNGTAVSLGFSTSRKFTDIRPLPMDAQTQQRSYFIRYVGAKNKAVGNYSNKVTVAVMRIV